MNDKTCCFTGHRTVPQNDIFQIQINLKEEIIKLIQQGICYFGAGGAIGFDTLAASAVLALRSIYPQIKLILILPCKGQTKSWKKEHQDTYRQNYFQADKVVYTSRHYFNGCMHKRNRHLVDNSNYCICYLSKNTGGTAYTVNYAREKGLKVINLYRG